MTDFIINRATDVLLVIDPQNDFCPGGSLAVAGGDEIMTPISVLSRLFDNVVVTGDWHPTTHRAFAVNHDKQPFEMGTLSYGEQILWPAHCVPGTKGAEFHPDVAEAVGRARLILRKGLNPEVHSYSAFLEDDQVTQTGLAGYLREIGIKRVIVVGLAYDFCAGYSAVDAVGAGFEALILKDLTRSIAMKIDTGVTAEYRTTEDVIDQKFEEVGVIVINSSQIKEG